MINLHQSFILKEMDKLPLVSVLMPAYNASKFIKQAIDSILNQTYQNIELLIADDASKDNTRTIIDSYHDKRIKRFHQDVNQGYLKTWNRLIAKAKGDFITFQDADDFSAPERIELQLKAFSNYSELGACGTNFIQVSEKGEEIKRSNYLLDYNDIKNAVPDFQIVGSSLMIKREVYEAVGGYHEFFDRIGVEDYYWTWLIMEKFQLMNLKESLYYYRINTNSVTSNLVSEPKKVFSLEICQSLIESRKNTGTDLLESGKEDELINTLNGKVRFFKENPVDYYYHIARRRFYEGRKKEALKLMLKVCLQSPLKLKYYRDAFYFMRKK